MVQVKASIATKAATYARLGLRNVWRVARYRALVRSGHYKRLLPVGKPVAGPFFAWDAAARGAARGPDGIDAVAWQQDGERVLRGELPVFSRQWANYGFPPAWRRSYLTGVELPAAQPHWSEIKFFSLPGGDIKGFWEPGRFDGLLVLALAWIVSRREEFREGLTRWLESWSAENPANQGVQWACGQEASLRMMQVLTVAALLRRWADVAPTDALCELVAEHCARIAPTMQYAVGQDNNHGTSEGAAMFAGGAFLERHARPAHREHGRQWRTAGQYWLQERVARLFMADGSFAQHSTNYHRMVLDTCSMAEFFRREFSLPEFSAAFRERCIAGLQWLEALTEPATGDAPVLGPNDGARLFVLHRLPYPDHRPSVALAASLWEGRRPYADAAVSEPLRWLGVDTAAMAGTPRRPDRLWPQGGYARLQRADTWLLLRLPVYLFRPSQSDALHLDLWHAGANVLRDAGTYSYNTEQRWLDYFGGVASHNTVQFDDRDQMPRISRFLFGAWLSPVAQSFDAAAGTVTSGYVDHRGARHVRSVALDARGQCTVTDAVSGFATRAVLRWRLPPAARGELSGDTWKGEGMQIRLRASKGFKRVALVEGWEAPYYGAMNPLPVLEAEVDADATITTEVIFET